MRIRNNGRNTLLTTFLVVAAQFWSQGQPHAQAQPVSILVVRHAETDTSQPALPLTAAGRQRAELLVQTLRGVKFTHIFASHTTRARQMVEVDCISAGPCGDPVACARLDTRCATGDRPNLTPRRHRADLDSLA